MKKKLSAPLTFLWYGKERKGIAFLQETKNSDSLTDCRSCIGLAVN